MGDRQSVVTSAPLMVCSMLIACTLQPLVLKDIEKVWLVVFWLGLLSVATTVKVLLPGFNVTVRLQFAVPDPDAVSPLARTPFTVTDEIPLSPRPASEAVPLRVIVLVDTICPLL